VIWRIIRGVFVLAALLAAAVIVTGGVLFLLEVGAERVKCEICPARNRRVRVFRVFGRDVALCPECRDAAERVAVKRAMGSTGMSAGTAGKSACATEETGG
jgi:hypothetical protein